MKAAKAAADTGRDDVPMNDKKHEAPRNDQQEEIEVLVQHLGYQSINEWKNTGRGPRYADYAADYGGYSGAQGLNSTGALHGGRMCFN